MSDCSVIGIDQISPEASEMFSQTERQSSEPMKPSSGAKPPFASSSKSDAWRELSSSARAVSALPIDAALRAIGSCPAAGAGVLVLAGPGCAGHASDRRISLVVKWVVGHVTFLYVVPDLLVVPVGQGFSFQREKRSSQPNFGA